MQLYQLEPNTFIKSDKPLTFEAIKKEWELLGYDKVLFAETELKMNIIEHGQYVVDELNYEIIATAI